MTRFTVPNIKKQKNQTYIVCHGKCVSLVGEGVAEESSSHRSNLKEEEGMEREGEGEKEGEHKGEGESKKS